MSKINMEVEVLKLKDAIIVAEDTDATEEDVAAALITIDKFVKKISIYNAKLSNRLEAINNAKQQELELVYTNYDGDSIGVLTEEIEHVSVDMVGIHKDAQANIQVSYSDAIYEQLFKPNVRANKKDVIRLAEEGVLPNSNQRVKKVTYLQTKLFDYKAKEEPNKE